MNVPFVATSIVVGAYSIKVLKPKVISSASTAASYFITDEKASNLCRDFSLRYINITPEQNCSKATTRHRVLILMTGAGENPTVP